MSSKWERKTSIDRIHAVLWKSSENLEIFCFAKEKKILRTFIDLMVSQHMFRLCCMCMCMHELRSSVCSFGCQYDSWWSLSLLCTRGSHKQYIFSVIVLFGAFNIVVIVFRSVFSSKPWVYIFWNLRAAHTHKRIHPRYSGF